MEVKNMTGLVEITDGVVTMDNGEVVAVSEEICQSFGKTKISRDDFRNKELLDKIRELFGSIESFRIVGRNNQGNELTIYGYPTAIYGIMNTGIGITQEFKWDTKTKKVYSEFTGNWID